MKSLDGILSGLFLNILRPNTFKLGNLLCYRWQNERGISYLRSHLGVGNGIAVGMDIRSVCFQQEMLQGDLSYSLPQGFTRFVILEQCPSDAEMKPQSDKGLRGSHIAIEAMCYSAVQKRLEQPQDRYGHPVRLADVQDERELPAMSQENLEHEPTQLNQAVLILALEMEVKSGFAYCTDLRELRQLL